MTDIQQNPDNEYDIYPITIFGGWPNTGYLAEYLTGYFVYVYPALAVAGN